MGVRIGVARGRGLVNHPHLCPGGEMADAGDLKSPGGDSVRVRIPPRAGFRRRGVRHAAGRSCVFVGFPELKQN